MHALDAEILSAECSFYVRTLSPPLVLSGATIREGTEARTRVRLRVGGREAEGVGSMMLSTMWAWPHPELSIDARDQAMRARVERNAREAAQIVGEPAHPLELGMRIHRDAVQAREMPVLAAVVCAAPLDAAIHDAVGQALNRPSLSIFATPADIPSADGWFADGAVRAISRVLRKPVHELPAWLIVGSKDDLELDVRPWVVDRGYSRFKVKLHGKDNAADVARTIAISQKASSWARGPIEISIDSNEGNPDAASVLDYLERLRAADENTFEKVKYLEQPTSRDILKHAFDWRSIASLKPVLMDEGLAGPDLLHTLIDQGWSGLAVKTCKGHSSQLVMAAWAHERNILLAMQDLTNPGFAAIHSAILAAHLPVINGIELNSPQFMPAANAEFLPRLAPLLDVRDGMHRLPAGEWIGLGSRL